MWHRDECAIQIEQPWHCLPGNSVRHSVVTTLSFKFQIAIRCCACFSFLFFLQFVHHLASQAKWRRQNVRAHCKILLNDTKRDRIFVYGNRGQMKEIDRTFFVFEFGCARIVCAHAQLTRRIYIWKWGPIHQVHKANLNKEMRFSSSSSAKSDQAKNMA